MRPKGGSAVLEMRRRLAVRMLRTGQTPSAVCKLLGVGRVTLWRWRTARSLAAAPSRGARSRLSHSQRRRLTRLLERDPTEHGWPTSLWTSGRVADLIRRRFGVRYHPAHVWRLLRAMGLSKQKPQSPRREQRWIIFLDEPGFMLQPNCRRTWALRGRTPTLRVWDRRDRRSVIGCVGLSPAHRKVRVDWRMYRHNIRAPQVEDFIRRQVERHRRVVLILDRWNAHRTAVRRLQAAFGRRLHVEWLPAYAPDLNPAEQIWNHAKHADLANFSPDGIAHLARRVGLSFHCQSRRTHLLYSFFKTARLRV